MNIQNQQGNKPNENTATPSDPSWPRHNKKANEKQQPYALVPEL